MSLWLNRPQTKEAEQFLLGTDRLPFSKEGACCFDGKRWYVVTTHGQETTIVHGDFIVREPDGNGFYPCKPEIWLATHEEIQ